MKRAFIRALWGEDDGDRYFGARRTKMDADLELLELNPHTNPFVFYTFGKENHQYLIDNGWESKLIWDEPYRHDYKKEGTHQYSMKLYAIQEAMKDYNEVILLDVDTTAICKLPEGLWDDFSAKEPLQAILRGYKLVKAHWRDTDRRKRPCASLVYCRDKQIADDMVKLWEDNPFYSEEDILGWTMDIMSDGWKGINYYWNHYEPMCFDLKKEAYAIFPPEKLIQKDLIFKHFNKVKRGAYVRKLKRRRK